MNPRTRFVTVVVAAAVVALMFVSCKVTPEGISATLAFDEMGGATYFEGETVDLDGVIVTVLPTQDLSGEAHRGGNAIVLDSNLAGGSGYELELNDACIGLNFGGRVIGIELRVGDNGDWVNLGVNGTLRTQPDLPGVSVAGVMITAVPNGSDAFNLTIAGEIIPTMYTIGGASGEFNLVIGGSYVHIDDVVSVAE